VFEVAGEVTHPEIVFLVVRNVHAPEYRTPNGHFCPAEHFAICDFGGIEAVPVALSRVELWGVLGPEGTNAACDSGCRSEGGRLGRTAWFSVISDMMDSFEGAGLRPNENARTEHPMNEDLFTGTPVAGVGEIPSLFLA